MDSVNKVIEACETLHNFCMSLDCNTCPLNGLIEDNDIFCYLFSMRGYAEKIREHKKVFSKLMRIH